MKFNQLLPELSVTDLQASLEFYKTIGFKIEYERPEDKFAFISFEDVQFMLQEIIKPDNSKKDKWDVGELKYPFGNGINFEIDINRQISTIYDKIRQAGYKIAFDIEENSSMFYLIGAILIISSGVVLAYFFRNKKRI